MDQRDLQPQTEHPGFDFSLPSNLELTPELDLKQGPNLQASNLNATDVCKPGQQAHLISLLDQLLLVTSLDAENKEMKLAKLAELDNKIRNFLEVIMAKLEERQTISCHPVALCVR